MKPATAISVAVVLVIYEQSDSLISRLLDQLDSLSWKPLSVYLVANEPQRSLRHFETRATVLEPSSNLGFCGGVNLAAKTAHTQSHSHLLLLNIDVELLVDDLVSRLATVFSMKDDCAFVSPGIVYWSDTSLVWYRGGQILRPFWIARHPGIGRKWRPGSRGVVRTDFFSGCCVMVDLASFLRAGGFDTKLFMYYDEADLAKRVADLDGRYSYLLDEPLLAHDKPGRKFNVNEAYYQARNSRILLDRNERGLAHLIGRSAQFAVAPLQLMRCESATARAAYWRGLRTRE